MKIAICGSFSFAKEILQLSKELEEHGHTVEIPTGIAEYSEGERTSESKWDSLEIDVFKHYYAVISKSDAILVANYSKNNIDGYIGGNALIEMGFAHVLSKRIYLLYAIPVLGYTDEIVAMKPLILNGNLGNIDG